MTDNFDLLNEPRRPWLDPEELKQKFLALTAAVHPDRSHHLSAPEREKAQQDYTALNAAYNCLREPKLRLRHLLELERGAPAKEIQQIPGELMDVFMEIGQACRQADAFIAEKNQATSPLLKVQFFARGQDEVEKLGTLQKQLGERRNSLMVELKNLDVAWMQRSPDDERTGLLDSLDALGRLFSYYDRWLMQLQERVIQLSF